MSSSGNTSRSSVVQSVRKGNTGGVTAPKISFINERKMREPAKSSAVRPRNVHKGMHHLKVMYYTAKNRWEDHIFFRRDKRSRAVFKHRYRTEVMCQTVWNDFSYV